MFVHSAKILVRLGEDSLRLQILFVERTSSTVHTDLEAVLDQDLRELAALVGVENLRAPVLKSLF
jgi:hypothetical protein